MEVCSEVGEYIIHPLSRARRVKANWKAKVRANERSETRRRCQEEAAASESKKEKDMSLTRDLSYDKLRW